MKESQNFPMPKVWPTVVHMLEAAAAQSSEHLALVCGDEQLTYGQYRACVAGFAHDLMQCGLGQGDRVVLLMGNSLDIAIASFAVQAAGAQVVPLNPAYTTSELRQVLASARARGIIYDEAVTQVVSQVGASFDVAYCIGTGPGQQRLTRWQDATALPLPLPDPNSPSTLQYTGGTTGVPKGVSLTHQAVSINVSQREALLPTLRGQEKVLAITPLFHVYAVSMGLYLAAYAQGTLVIMPKYRPDTVLQAIAQHRITLMSGSPTIFMGLMAYEGFEQADLSSLRLCSSGSAALAEETLTRWQAATGCVVCEGYGQTEAGPVLTYNPFAGQRKLGSVGVAVPLTQLQIVDVATGTQVLPVGEAGEVRARGPQIMSGYDGMPEETAKVLRDGWLHTGDIGRLDDQGYLTICDRKKEMAIVSGFNVYPREIEEVLFRHPGVSEAAVIGVSDAYRGEILLAYVVAKDSTLDEAALQAYLAEHLVKYKWPSRVFFVTELPKTSVGKIDKNTLRRRLASDVDAPGQA
ncbi:long-chain fatty acid--CoA ligase [Pusillimonas sp. CC-YST705]|uniref:Long-chain fatty acid--CoA ligase n=1 Tax=Mesopusillimonas faecipullorum TaxID=2755040 RepID=A0ABS8C9D7_9BURK|nr:long-chain fatty acid--CoA ligase [Mesopusillimonas faecipullorum]MCB5362643.1 long-chain fatty acid--CoA ligase [Mesopusillimonas faecipullorum]